MALVVVFFVLAIASDWITCWWHRSREQERVWLASLLSMLLETLTWLPFWFAFQLEDWRIAAVSIWGAGIGTAIGLRPRSPRQRRRPPGPARRPSLPRAWLKGER